MIQINVQLGSRSYPVYIGKNLLPEIGNLISKINPDKEKLLLVSDKTVYDFYGDYCLKTLRDVGFQVISQVIPPGEESKNLSVLNDVYNKAIEANLDRNSLIVALGGGVVGDLAGFAAATFMRGIPFVQIPTTLLAQVDSSVGGKTGINHPLGKNMIGSFHQPRAVFIDIETLKTLPDREYRAGLAEVIKYGLIGNTTFLNWLKAHLKDLISKDPQAIMQAVGFSVKSKAEIVESDEKESGKRKLLNLGHTFGHALEAASKYNYYLHGEAVLVGMEMALSLSRELNLIENDFAEEMKEMLSLIGLKEPPSDLAPETVFNKLIHDKKREGEDLIFILPRSKDEALIYRNPPEKAVRKIIIQYLNSKNN